MVRQKRARSQKHTRSDARRGPFLSFFVPGEILELAPEADFRNVQHVSADSLAQRYFAEQDEWPSWRDGALTAQDLQVAGASLPQIQPLLAQTRAGPIGLRSAIVPSFRAASFVMSVARCSSAVQAITKSKSVFERPLRSTSARTTA